MTETRTCTACGSSLPADAPRGLCPKCLLGAGTPTAAYRPAEAPRADPGGPVVPLDLPAFRLAVLDLGLLGPEELEPFVAGASGDVLRLSRALVRAGKLTSYQAGVLAQGKGKGLAIGPYLVLEKRGQGGMGVVFKARDRRSGRVVALKILLPSFGRDREAVRRFRREFEVAARLDHPNVVAAMEADEDRGVQYLTMEYVEGNDLDDLVREVGALPIKLSLHCAIQAARGLAAAHAEGIVHRDIKPANLILDPSGTVRVLDLGLARVIESTSPFGRDTSGTLTQSGSYMGTVDYIAPEQANDSKRADHRADIYSLGCTLYYLLAGRPPFGGETVLQVLMAHQQRPAPSLRAARGDVPAALEAAYQTMMAKHPDDRPRSMGEVVELLEACRTSSGEAKEAREGLRSFAETIMKRAAPKKRGWGVDPSIFARPRAEADGPQFDPDLRLEDLVTDYRKEEGFGALPEDKLPPKLPRLRPPRKPVRRPTRGAVTAGLVLMGAIAAASLVPRLIPKEEGRPRAVASTASADEGKEVGFVPLFRGDDLGGWRAVDSALSEWHLGGGVLSARGRRDGWMTLVGPEEYRDFALRVEVLRTEGTDGGIVLLGAPDARNYLVEVGLDGGPDSANLTGALLWSGDGPARGETRPSSPARDLKPAGSWNAVEIRVRGGTLIVALNGRTLSYAADPGDVEGPHRIAFRVRSGDLRLRNVEIRDLKARPGASSPAPFDLDGLWRVTRSDGVAGLRRVKGPAIVDENRTSRTWSRDGSRITVRSGTRAGEVLTIAADTPDTLTGDDGAGTKVRWEREKARSVPPPDPQDDRTVPPGALVVSADGRAPFRSVQEALDRAGPGARVRVEPGRYNEEFLRLDKPVELVGAGKPGDVVIEMGGHGFRLGSAGVVLRNLTIRGTNGVGAICESGEILAEDCDFHGTHNVASIHNPGTRAVFRRCRFRGSTQNGIWINKGADATFEECEVSDNGWEGLLVEAEGTKFSFLGGRVHNNRRAGVRFVTKATGTVEDSDVFANSHGGVTAEGASELRVVGSRLYWNASGVFISEDSRGTVLRSDLSGNAERPFDIRDGGQAERKGNREG